MAYYMKDDVHSIGVMIAEMYHHEVESGETVTMKSFTRFADSLIDSVPMCDALHSDLKDITDNPAGIMGSDYICLIDAAREVLKSKSRLIKDVAMEKLFEKGIFLQVSFFMKVFQPPERIGYPCVITSN